MLLDPGIGLVTLLRTVVDIKSVSGNEKRLANLAEEVLRTQPHLEVARDGDCVVARTRLGRAQRVLIAGHLDTVLVTGNLPSTVEETPEGVVIHGRGTVDMKGGATVALKLACELNRPRFDITWAFYDREEVDTSLNGLGRLVGNRPDLLEGDFAVPMEPTGARVEGGCQGTVRIRIIAEGRTTHSARAWMGDNAIHGLANVFTWLAAHESKRIEVDGLKYREGLNAVRIGGGVVGSIIPPKVWVKISYRFAPDKSLDEALGYLGEVFDGYTFEVTDLSPVARPGLDGPLAQEFVDAVGGRTLPKYGWTDVFRLSALGIPAVSYGPGDSSSAHRDDERCPAEHLRICADGLRRWLVWRRNR